MSGALPALLQRATPSGSSAPNMRMPPASRSAPARSPGYLQKGVTTIPVLACKSGFKPSNVDADITLGRT